MLSAAMVIAFVVALVGTWRLSRPDTRWAAIDVPNARSMHDQPIPRGGGLALLLGVMLAVAGAALFVELTWRAVPVLGAVVLVAGVSFVDDRQGLSIGPRLATHFIAALVIVWGADLAPPTLSVPGLSLAVPTAVSGLLAVLAVVWLTNLFNFMDGIDGFAGGMAVIGFATLALLAAGSAPGLVAVAAITSAAAAGFLVFNFPPARIFMGDVGSSALGLLAGGLILWGDVVGAFPWWLGALSFAVFIVDASVTLVRRALNRERVWQAHRSHFYQRIVTLGWSQTATVMMYYGLLLVTALAALGAQSAGVAGQWLCVAIVALTQVALMVIVTLREGRR